MDPFLPQARLFSRDHIPPELDWTGVGFREPYPSLECVGSAMSGVKGPLVGESVADRSVPKDYASDEALGGEPIDGGIGKITLILHINPSSII